MSNGFRIKLNEVFSAAAISSYIYSCSHNGGLDLVLGLRKPTSFASQMAVLFLPKAGDPLEQNHPAIIDEFVNYF